MFLPKYMLCNDIVNTYLQQKLHILMYHQKKFHADVFCTASVENTFSVVFVTHVRLSS